MASMFTDKYSNLLFQVGTVACTLASTFERFQSKIFYKILAIAFLTGIALPSGLEASSHREAPLIADDPLADNVDVYAFKNPRHGRSIILVATYVPLQLPQ